MTKTLFERIYDDYQKTRPSAKPIPNKPNIPNTKINYQSREFKRQYAQYVQDEKDMAMKIKRMFS